MNQLKCIKVSTSHHVELMRCIYNDNLDMLSTHPLPYRTYEEQQEWWQIASTYSEAYLYEPYSKPGKYVAFLLLRYRAGFCTPTIAIQKEEWGSKYGQEIVKDYILKANGPIAGTQLQSNKAICHINSKLGWQILGTKKIGEKYVDLLFHPGINKNNQCTEIVFNEILNYLGIEKNESIFSFEQLNKPYYCLQ